MHGHLEFLRWFELDSWPRNPQLERPYHNQLAKLRPLSYLVPLQESLGSGAWTNWQSQGAEKRVSPEKSMDYDDTLLASNPPNALMPGIPSITPFKFILVSHPRPTWIASSIHSSLSCRTSKDKNRLCQCTQVLKGELFEVYTAIQDLSLRHDLRVFS